MYHLLYSLVYLVSLIPRRVGLVLGNMLGLGLYYGLKSRRRIALNNLSIAFGDQMGFQERRLIAKKSFQFMGRHFLEVCYLLRYKKEKLASYVQFKGVTHFEQAR
ncbi:MAG: hypothetical protein C0407_09860, partial [Desulfobacca sp.]|nr:hypothetical protein [Desulfobacca sp.]